MSAKGGSAPFSRILAGFKRQAWAAGLRGRAVTRSGGRALESLGPRRYLAFVHDIAMAAMAFHLAVLVDVALSQKTFALSVALSDGLYAFLAAVGVFGAMRLHRRPWSRFADDDIRAVLKATIGQTISLAAVLALASEFDLLSVPLIVANWVLLNGLLLTPRALVKFFQKGSARTQIYAPGDVTGRLPVLLVGAGDKAKYFIKTTDRDPNCLYSAVGIVDEMGPYLRSNIAGVEIFGRITEISTVVKRLASRGVRPKMLVITEDRLSPETMRMLLDEATLAGLVLNRVSDLAGRGYRDRRRAWLRPVPVEELLDRGEPLFDADAIRSIIANARILISGAGGPIGAELARQVCACGPAQVTLIDNDETNLFDITQELQADFPASAPVMALCDVSDRDRVRYIFARYRPQIVFHTAAMSHIAVAEDHPCETVLANVMASRYMADACIEFGAMGMVLVSSAEADDPVNVLGQTWKISELYCRLVDRHGGRTEGAPRLMSLRLPDVWDGPGSVVARLERQLANGGPLTISGPDTANRFITASAAATAILQTAVIGLQAAHTDGRAYTVEVTDPIRLRDLASLMVRLAGLVPEKDVEIAYTGPRPGENRQLSRRTGTETLRPTDIPGLMQILDSPAVDFEPFLQGIEELDAAARGQAKERVRAMLCALIAHDPGKMAPEGSGAVMQVKR